MNLLASDVFRKKRGKTSWKGEENKKYIYFLRRAMKLQNESGKHANSQFHLKSSHVFGQRCLGDEIGATIREKSGNRAILFDQKIIIGPLI